MSRAPASSRRTPLSSMSTQPVVKYKAALSKETVNKHAKPKLNFPASSSSSSTLVASSSSSDSLRPRTPGTPTRARSPNGSFAYDDTSEMDVSRVDPEEVLVHAGDVSVDSVNLDDGDILKSIRDADKRDKVLVSIRLKPSDKNAWTVKDRSISLQAEHSRNAFVQPAIHTFDHIAHAGNPSSNTQKSIYETVAKGHVLAAMDGYNALVFAYGQTASGKSHTLTGTSEEPGITPRAMKDIFSYIRQTPTREYLLRCSYLEIYNENVVDLLAPPGSASQVTLTSMGLGGMLREEVVINLDGVKKVLERGEKNRRTASTDWNERSSRSHSVFRVVIESRERLSETEGHKDHGSGRVTPGLSGRMTPGGTRLQSRGGRAVQTSVLSLIDLAGSEKATSDKDRTREGRYINTSLLTLGAVISTLAENAAKRKSDHVPYRNSKLTRLLQPSLAGDSLIAVVCTLNPGSSAVAESLSTLGFASRIKKVSLNAKKKETVGDVEALLERYRQEIEDLKAKLADREEAGTRPDKGGRRRLSAREQIDEIDAQEEIRSRVKQISKLILVSENVEDSAGSVTSSPSKVNFDMEPYMLQRELLAARGTIDAQATQILSLEASLAEKARASTQMEGDEEKDRLIRQQADLIAELERTAEEDESAILRCQLAEERRRNEELEEYQRELFKQLDKEKHRRDKLVEFVREFDRCSLGSPTKTPLLGNKTRNSVRLATLQEVSPVKIDFTGTLGQRISLVGDNLMDTQIDDMTDLSFDADRSFPSGKENKRFI